MNPTRAHFLWYVRYHIMTHQVYLYMAKIITRYSKHSKQYIHKDYL